jgi:hypothetical protein
MLAQMSAPDLLETRAPKVATKSTLRQESIKDKRQ